MDDKFCPSCGTLLEKHPKRKTKCPHCSESVYVRGDELYNEDGIDRMEIMTFLADFNIQEEDFERYRTTIANKHKVSLEEVSDKFTAASIINGLIDITREFWSLENLYRMMAHLQEKEGEDNLESLQLTQSMRLKQYLEDGIKKVEIHVSEYSCPQCKENDGKIITIKDALRAKILP